ncbi:MULTISPECIES: methyltransferase [Streptomyces]|uniref:methyltransferase n=1 Tax=Streptomyces TaxID=1883 RepID=UPI000249409F|nr:MULTISPECIES: methyltransferase [Streptomyces]MBO1284560.1 hydroxyneurosporene methyltransferase [Streptomyces sampsonii]MCX5456704.1 methyltransferase [Streptomyces sp. FT1]NVI31900.1 hydroxyneurosporene methyltransferase [Streptomyces sp. CAI-17]
MLPSALEKAVYGVYATTAVHLADKHGVFGLLVDREATAGKIASELGLDEETLTRLLVLLDSFGVVERDEEGAYRVPEEAAPFLDPRNARSVGGFLSHVMNSTLGRLSQLDAYLSAGKPAVDAALPAPFDVMYKTPELTADFLTAMWQLTYDVSRELVPMAGLAGVRHLVDVGGASGPFCVAALQATPGLRATVFELPEVEPYVAETVERYGLEGRLDFAPGDFHRDEFPATECVAFGYVLSGWTDETGLELLRKAYRACSDGGRVLIMDRLFDDDHRGPLPTAVMNLSMHVEAKGRHRTAAEYIGLLESAGFTDCEVHRTTQDKQLVTGVKR